MLLLISLYIIQLRFIIDHLRLLKANIEFVKVVGVVCTTVGNKFNIKELLPQSTRDLV